MRGRTRVCYFVDGVDRENIDEQLEGLAESHWAYMDEMAATVLPRIPAAEYRGSTRQPPPRSRPGRTTPTSSSSASTSSSTASNGSGAPADVGDAHGERMKAVVYDRYGPPDVLRSSRSRCRPRAPARGSSRSTRIHPGHRQPRPAGRQSDRGPTPRRTSSSDRAGSPAAEREPRPPHGWDLVVWEPPLELSTNSRTRSSNCPFARASLQVQRATPPRSPTRVVKASSQRVRANLFRTSGRLFGVLDVEVVLLVFLFPVHLDDVLGDGCLAELQEPGVAEVLLREVGLPLA
jgi:hypothetical protein